MTEPSGRPSARHEVLPRSRAPHAAIRAAGSRGLVRAALAGGRQPVPAPLETLRCRPRPRGPHRHPSGVAHRRGKHRRHTRAASTSLLEKDRNVTNSNAAGFAEKGSLRPAATATATVAQAQAPATKPSAAAAATASSKKKSQLGGAGGREDSGEEKEPASGCVLTAGARRERLSGSGARDGSAPATPMPGAVPAAAAANRARSASVTSSPRVPSQLQARPWTSSRRSKHRPRRLEWQGQQEASSEAVWLPSRRASRWTRPRTPGKFVRST